MLSFRGPFAARTVARDRAFLSGLAGLVEHERATLADQDFGPISRARESLSFELLVAGIAQLRDRGVAAQLASTGDAATLTSTQIETLHRLLLAAQDLRAIARARLHALFATSVTGFRDRSVALSAAFAVRAAARATTRQELVRASVTGEHAVLTLAGRSSLVVGATRVARLVAAKVAARPSFGRGTAAGSVARCLHELSRLAGKLTLAVETAGLALVAGAASGGSATLHVPPRTEPKQQKGKEPQSALESNPSASPDLGLDSIKRGSTHYRCVRKPWTSLVIVTKRRARAWTWAGGGSRGILTRKPAQE